MHFDFESKNSRLVSAFAVCKPPESDGKCSGDRETDTGV